MLKWSYSSSSLRPRLLPLTPTTNRLSNSDTNEPTTRMRCARIPTFFATDDLLVVAFEQLRRDKCTLDVVHEAFSGRTRPSLVLVVLDQWNGISYDRDEEELLRAPANDRSTIVNDYYRGLKQIRLSWSSLSVEPAGCWTAPAVAS